MVAVGRTIDENMTAEARRCMEHYSLGKYDLSIIQGAQTDSLMLLNNEISRMASSREAEHQKLLELSADLSTANAQLAEYTRFENLPAELRNEMAALFPQVHTLSLSRVSEASRDTLAVSHFVAAIVSTDDNEPLLPNDAQRLRRWLKARVQADSLMLVERN